MWHQPVSKTNVQTLFRLLRRSCSLCRHAILSPLFHPTKNCCMETKRYFLKHSWIYLFQQLGDFSRADWLRAMVCQSIDLGNGARRKVFFSLSSPLFCKKRRREKTIKVRSKCSELCRETIRLQLMVSLEFSTLWRPLSSLAKENFCLILLNSKCDSINYLVQLGCDAGITFHFNPSQACRRNTSTHTCPIGTLRRGGAR